MRAFGTHISRFANNFLLGGLGFGLENKKKFKGTTMPLMANLDITHLATEKQVL